ncbi:MAG: hypothetical protein GTN76_07855 [Candidatus Aenigmarchaeota archaeon]|nr:hypothetical protein [Candidatus Aenigmarchaeota archaeon]
MSRQSRFRGLVVMLTLVLALGVFSQGVQGIGVTPGRKTVDFEPNLFQKVNFDILNNDHKAFNALVYVEGDLKDYVTLEKNLVEFKESDNSKPFTYTVRLPERIDKPGEHWGKIVVMELPPGMEAEEIEGQFVIATTAVIHQLLVKVPYPGKYAEMDLSIAEAQPSETVNFFVKVYNLGTQNIGRAKATVEIKGPTNEVIATIETDEISIKSKERKDLAAYWKADVNPGVYHAVATLDYDGNLARKEDNFYVGNLFVEVKEVTVKGFRLGGVAKFNILVESKWNEKIENVYAEMIITDPKGDVVTSFKSASVDIEPLQKETLLAYWDTVGVEKGVYDAKLILHYAGKTTERKLKTYIELESLTTEIIGVTAEVLRREEEGGYDVLTPLVIILIMINMGWFFYFRRRRRSG